MCTKKIGLLFLILLLLSITAGAHAITIAQSGRANAVIVVSADAIESEKHAADELDNFLSQVTGAEFEITNRPVPGKSNLFVGPGAGRLVDSKLTVDDLGTDGIIIRTVGSDIILAGGRPRGTLYAVYTFLEDYVGCRWWSSTASTIPSKPMLRTEEINIRYIPQFEYRNISYFDARDADYSVRNKLNGQSHRLFIDDGWHNARPDARRGGRKYAYHKSDKWTSHSFWTLIPPEVYFEDHPEWFAEVNPTQAYGTGFDGMPNAGGKGRRAKTIEQLKKELRSLCLSNGEMLDELVRNSKLAINWSPISTIFNVGQIDGMNPCRCENCMKIVNQEGAYSGLMIRFVNDVAEKLSTFTSMPIDTLAYHYTRKPPKNVKTRENVIVWLVVAYDEIAIDPNPTREISFSKPLTDSRNRSFYDDLVGWTKACDRLFIYDYAVNFSHPILPHPNLRVLGPNMKLYADNGVKGFQSEAHVRIAGTEFAELRAWLLAKLAWNPSLDGQKLIEEFCSGYYGAGGQHVLAYINTIHDAIDLTGEWLHPGWGYNAQYLSFETLGKSWRHLKAAEKAVENNMELRCRVQVAQLPVMYAFMMNWDKARGDAKAARAAWPLPESMQKVF